MKKLFALVFALFAAAAVHADAAAWKPLESKKHLFG